MKNENKNKSKLSMQLTKKDSILITVLVITIMVIGLGKYLLIPKYNELKQKQSNLSDLRQVYQVRQADYDQKSVYEEKEKTLNEQYGKLVQNLPPYIAQEDIILTIGELAKSNNINIETVKFDNVNTIEVKNFLQGKAEETDNKNTQNSESTKANGAKENTNISVPSVLSKVISIEFCGDIQSIYKFLDSIEKNSKKVFVKDITISKGKEKNDPLKGNIKIQYIAYKDSSSKGDFKIDVPKQDGKDNPFDENSKGSSFTEEETEELKKKMSDYGINLDNSSLKFFMKIDSEDVNSPKVVVGQGENEDSQIQYDESKQVKAQITVSKEKDSLVYEYSLGKDSKKGNIAYPTSGEVISLLVNSQPRESKKDDILISMKVINNTEIPFEITVKNDDKENPKVKLESKTGTVNLKNE